MIGDCVQAPDSGAFRDAGPLRPDEAGRLRSLQSFAILDTVSEAAFDRLTRIAAHLFKTEMALISFIDSGRQWVKSRVGTELLEMSRAEAICNTTINSDDVLIVPDCRLDPRFSGLPVIPRFYAGAPIITADGYRIGTICVLDTRPRQDFSMKDAEMLSELARSVMADLELRRQMSELTFQERLNAAIAAADNFQAGLNAALTFLGERVGACLCLVPQRLAEPGFMHIAAGVALHSAFEAGLARELAAEKISLDRVSLAAALIEQMPILEESITLDRVPEHFTAKRGYVAAGAQSQLVVPFTIGNRCSAVLVCFMRPQITKYDRDFVTRFVANLVPLLRGRLQEQNLEHERVRVSHANRAMRTLLAANHALTHAQTEQELVDRICHVVVEEGGYTTAVVGFAEADEARSVRIVATSGPHASIMRSLKTSWADTPDGNGPCGIAIRENRIVVMRDLQHNPAFKRWRLMAQKTHHHACIAIPLHRRDRSVLGALLIYNNETSTAAREILPFDVEEAELLNQLGSNLGFGIGAIRARAAHNEARQLQIASEQRLDHLVAASPAILYALEYDGRNWRVVELTRNFERILGYAVEVGMTSAWWEGRIHPDDREGAQHAHLRVINGERTVSHYRVARASGGYCWLRDESVLIPETHGHPARILGTWLDTTEKQEAEAEIHRLAFFDSLTGLPNRRLFHDRLNVSLIESRRSGESCAVMLLDLDGFKEINDIYGHAAGDRVLTEVGDRLSRGLRGGDTVARLGGDEFVVMLPQLRGQQDTATERVLVLAQKLGLSIEKPILIDGHPVCVACSIGISLYPSHADNADNILKAADIAMYAAKATTKDRVWSSDQSSIAVFEPSMRVVVTDQHRIQAEIRAALAEDRFELWLQRQVDDSGNIIGAEALIRLRTEDGRLIPPLDFIPVAETTGLIIPIGHWLISEACRLLARIDSVRLPRLSINISAIEFRQPRFVEMMLERLQKAGVDATRLTVEITESLLIERLDQTIINLQKLRAYGLRISVDDFGTGYSGLAFLQRLPISEIKIDRRFINEMLTDQGSSGVTQTLITLARNLGFDIIAEGVETLEQAAFLQHHGCQSMQGFLFGRPEPASNYQAFMVENEHANAGMPAVSLTEPQRAGMFGDGVS